MPLFVICKSLSALLETIKEIKAELDKPQSEPVIIPLQRYFDMRNAKAYSQTARVNNLKELNNMANYQSPARFTPSRIWKVGYPT